MYHLLQQQNLCSGEKAGKITILKRYPQAKVNETDEPRKKIKHICGFSRYRLNVRLTARIHPLLRGHKYMFVFFLGFCLLAVYANAEVLQVPISPVPIPNPFPQVSGQYMSIENKANFDFTPNSQKTASSAEPIAYICGLRQGLNAQA